MKSLKCDVKGCDHEINGEDFNTWVQVCYKHWKKHHADLMKNGTKKEGEKWMIDARKRFDAV